MKAFRTAMLAALALVSFAAFAEARTVTLSVPGMNCALCPVTIKKSLANVAGVSSVEVRNEHKQAVVTFDDRRTTIEALREATARAGYPSTVQE